MSDGTTVLVVDDHEINVNLLRHVLAKAGIGPVYGVTSPRQAIDLYRSVRPDLVLLDLHMPDMDGFAVMDALAELRGPDDFVPVVVLTADSTAASRERALAAGATDFLTKPFDQVEVVLRTKNLLHARALHRRVERNNDALRAEVEQGRAEEERARAEHEAKVTRITSVMEARDFHMVFQPIVELGSGAAVGHEALARFDCDPRRTPDVWFAEAAAVGLDTELELAAVARALDVLPTLPSEVFLTVNVSPETVVASALGELLEPHLYGRVVLEITEHAAVADYARLLAGLRPLRERGVRVAIDDAGAGFASLQHILRLRPDIIKLDISLVRGIDAEPVKRALASSLVAFAAEIESIIVAEGIETEEEQQALARLGIRWGQGFLLGRPAEPRFSPE
jgi:EAL domain-containing protein (putative c-di-GMP-specific phosphodiesterase class I)